jgi:transcriptional regulator with XRE-family HTH domain
MKNANKSRASTKTKRRIRAAMTNRPLYNRRVFDVLVAIRGISSYEVAARSGVSLGTIRAMRLGPAHGGTRYPRAETLEAILQAVGKRTYIGEDNNPKLLAMTINADPEDLPTDKEVEKAIYAKKMGMEIVKKEPEKPTGTRQKSGVVSVKIPEKALVKKSRQKSAVEVIEVISAGPLRREKKSRT